MGIATRAEEQGPRERGCDWGESAHAAERLLCMRDRAEAANVGTGAGCCGR